jgi:nitrite reductase (NO-forming)
MQGEVYTEEPAGTPGLLNEDFDRLLDERPSYFVFNGHVGALTDHYPLRANVGETVRIYMGVGGPNAISSFHVIGEIFDRVYLEGSLSAAPHENVQTIKVAPGALASSSSAARCRGSMSSSTTRSVGQRRGWRAT